MSQTFHFMLIDDNELDLFINEKFLTMEGMAASIRSFSCAEDALQYIEKNGTEMPATVILLDLQMPGMNGFGFVDVFASFNETLRNKLSIYILSSTVDRGDIEKAKSNPYIKDIISKPLDIALLQSILATE